VSTASSNGSEINDRRAAIDDAIAVYIEASGRVEPVSLHDFVATHSELMPELGEELQKLLRVREAWQQAQQGAARYSLTPSHDRVEGDGSSTGRLRIRCAHCQTPIDIDEDTSLSNITCVSCGGSFSIVGREERHQPGALLGHFHLVEPLGVGGFGTVWRAVDTELDRHVAVKIPRRGRVEPREVEQFLREARTAAQLQHANIVRVHEVGHDGDSVYIVSELVDGVTLSEWQPSGRGVAPRVAARMCSRIAEALDYAHQRGVVHRDLKPQNIMVDAGDEPHLMDFGLARRDGGETTVTMDGNVLGTPAYMSPEQARGQGHAVDGRTDIYSLGVILYQLITGELPFRGTPRMLLHQVLNDEPRRPRSLSDHVPRDLETICLRAMSKEPSGRYATAREMADDLQRFLQGLPIHARAIGRAERAWRWCRRNPVVAGLSTGVFAAVAALVVVLAVTTMRERARALDLQDNLALQYLRRGQSLCEQGDLARGLHWLARSLKEARAQNTSLKDVVRANLAGWSEQWVPPRAFLELDATLQSIALSPDGKRAVTGSDGGIVQFWSAETGEPLPVVKKHSSSVWRIVFSPDGGRVASCSTDHTACLWDAQTGAPLGETLHHEDEVWDAAFSPDGTLVATASYDHTVRLWNTTTGEPVGAPMRHDGPVDRVAFCLHGTRLVTAGSSPDAIRLWSVPTGESIDAAIHAEVDDVVVSPDGMTVAIVSDRTVRLWSAESTLQTGDPIRHEQPVTCVAFSSDNKYVLTGSTDDTARLWDARTGQPTGIALAHDGDVLAAQFSEDGKWILTGAWDGMARLWAADTGKLLGRPLHHSFSLRVPLVALAGRTVMTATSGSLAALWSVEPEAKGYLVPPDATGGFTAAFSPDDSRLLISDGSLRSATWWSPDSGQLEPSAMWDGEWLWAVALSADGKRALVGGRGAKTAQLWSLERGERLLFDLPHPDQVRAVAFSRDAKLVATACYDTNARLWSAENGQPVGKPMQHSAMVEDVGFSPDDKLIVTACGDWAARIWSVQTRRQIGPPLRHREQVLAATFSPDGKLVATGSRDNTARLWNVATGHPVGSALEHPSWIDDVCFSPDGKQLATVSFDGSVRLWSVETGELLGPPLKFGGWPHEVVFSHDGKSIAVTGAAEGTCLSRVPSFLGIKLADEDAELRLQVLTWMEMDANGVVGRLDRKTWQARRTQLAKATGK
jgi:WD40 repeat protein